jgi:aryl-alcohol dehydrogenase-like predicted oxidoreductase
MKRHFLGTTGISVSELTLGAMMFGARGNTDHDDAIRVIHRALDGGINCIDTADIYSFGESEIIVGKALRDRRDEVVLATKFGLPMGPDENTRGGSARWIALAVEGSLRRLGTDHIDLYQMHRPDPHTDIDDTLGALSDLVHAGKVRVIGSTTSSAEGIVEAQWAAQRGGHERFRSEQPRYSILTRTIEAAVLPTAARYGMGVLTYGPLNSGWLSGRADLTGGHRATTNDREFNLDVPGNAAKFAVVDQLTALAREVGVPLTHLALGFARSHPAVTSVIIGPRTATHLDDLLAGVDLVLDDAVLDRIDDIVPPGTELNPADNYLAAPAAIVHKHLRRRTPPAEVS